ncbi:MAG: putative Ig domain-containing protein, partial [Chthoniobacterales bacterium]|nr:putative Ig domain-containing protein [Chthoniobacterales bacterium]
PGPGSKIYREGFYPPGLSDSSHVVFWDPRDDGTGSSAIALYSGLPGSIALLAEKGGIVPGAPGPISYLYTAGLNIANSPMPINDANRTAFGATFEGGSGGPSILVGAPGSISIAAESGMQAPGLPSGVTFYSLYTGTLSLKSEDRLAFAATLFDNSTQAYTQGLFAGLPNSLAFLARTGDPAAGTDPGVFYDLESSSVFPSLSESRTVAFGGYLTGLGVRDSNSNALWVGVPGALELVARGDMQAPGVEPGVTYGLWPGYDFPLPFYAVINSSGEIAFTQYLSTEEHALWAGPLDNLRLVARQGQSAPGLAPGETLGGFGNLYINETGSVAFQAVIGDVHNLDSAIYVGNPDGELVYVTRVSEPVTLDNGQILFFSFPFFPDGFNSKGQVLIHASLSDGSDGLFLADTAVPVVTSATTTSGAIGVPFSYQITATNSPTSFSATGRPPGLNINGTTGLISGTPTVIGTFDTAISATNSVGQGPATTLMITVAPAPTPTPTPSPSPSASPSPSPSASPSPSPSASPSPSPSASPSPSPSVSPSPSPSASPSPSPSASPSPSPSASPSPTPFFPVQLANISTRLSVGTDDSVLIGGFIVAGMQSKAVIIRAIGPSLPLGGVLSDPILEIHDSTGATIATNDNWQESANKQAIIDAGFAPTNDNESAILLTLNPGPYTAIVRGV